MSNYNEALDSEKRNLSQLVESDLYPPRRSTEKEIQPSEFSADQLLKKIKSDPSFSQQLLQLLLNSAEKGA